MSKQEFNDTIGAWRERATKELKGKALESLNWKNSSGLVFHPYYSAEESTRRFPVQFSRNSAEWGIIETIPVQDAKAANKAALEALNAGANALLFELKASVSFSDLLSEIGMPYICTAFKMQMDAVKANAASLRAFIEHAGFEANACKGYLQIGLDDAKNADDLATRIEALTDLHAEVQELLPGFRIGVIDGALFANRGLKADQELGLSLFWYQYLLENGFETAQMNLGCGREFYTELVKFRIAGNLAAQVAAAYTKNHSLSLYGQSTSSYLSDLDRYSNLLRLSTAAMSAVLGGAEGIRLESFSRNASDAESFKTRITRNVQLVLHHETGIGSVQDAAAGSYFLEEMSFRLAEQAWDFFVSLQGYESLPDYIRSAAFDALLEDAGKQLEEGVKSRKTFFLGVNQYPSTLEKTPELEAEETGPFEALYASEIFHHLKQNTPLQKALLLKKGNLAMRNARAGFVANFLRCGNWEMEEVLWDGKALPKADLYVLCAADEDYADWVKDPLLQGKNTAIAGYPGEMEQTYRDAGIRHFIHVKSHLFTTLNQLAGRHEQAV